MDQLIGLLAMYILPLIACSLYVRSYQERTGIGYATKEGIVSSGDDNDLRSALLWIGAIAPMINFVMMLFVMALVAIKR